jgi:hypothetical protein
MARRCHRPEPDLPAQLPLPASPAKPRRTTGGDLEDRAKVYIARRSKPSVVPGHVQFTFTLDLPRAVAERLDERAIRDGTSLEATVIEVLKAVTNAQSER